MTDPDTLLRKALEEALAGRSADGMVTLQSLLTVAPGHVEGLRLLGKLLLGAGRPEQALAVLGSAAAGAPDHPDLAHEAGVAALGCQRTAEAVAWFSRQLETNRRQNRPGTLETRFNLAWARRRLGQTEAAITTYREVVAIEPGHGLAWYNLANALSAAGRLTEASEAYRMALVHLGRRPEVVTNAVLVLLRREQVAEARRVLAPGSDPGPSVGRRALEGEVLMAERRLPEALACFQRLRADHPEHRPSLLGEVRCLCALGRVAEATARLAEALRDAPEDAELNLIRAEVALKDDDLGTASAAARRAVTGLGSIASYATLGKALALSGRTAEAAEAFRAGLQRYPDCYGLHSNLLFCLLHDAATTPEDVFAEHQAFGRFWEHRFPVPAFRPAPAGTEAEADLRPVRVGYVSPDFCDHAVAFFFEPLLDGHDPTQVEVFCYHIPRTVDAVTARLRAKAGHWRVLAFEDLPGAIETIRRDRIDVLVDLAGHTAFNMLPVFAAKPAPVQISGLGYPGTTGLTRIDYRLVCASGAKNSDDPRFSTETPVAINVPFAAPANLPPVSPPPFLRQGRITFGSVSKLVKVGEPVQRTWARILEQVPEARLLLVAPGVEQPAIAQDLRNRLAAAGLPAERLELRPECRFETWLGYLSEIDIVLDPFPYTAGTTTTLLQWMGLPVVRLGPVPYPELGLYTGASEAAYIAVAVALATDPATLFRLRASLRANALMFQHTRNSSTIPALEALYRRLWQEIRQRPAVP